MNRAGARISLNPIFQLQTTNSFEFPFVVGRKLDVEAQRTGRYQQIHGTDGTPRIVFFGRQGKRQREGMNRERRFS